MSYVVGLTSTYSKQANRFPANYPRSLTLGNGCTVRGGDGKTYIDMISGLGAIFLGYQNEAVDRAVMRQLRVGTLFSLPHVLEEEVAGKLCRVTGWEQLRWCKNGSDATEAAVRVARRVTGRDSILTLGGYHGFHSDLVTSSPGKSGGIPLSTTLLALEPSGPFFLEQLAHYADSAACLIAEPIMFSRPQWSNIVDTLKGSGCLLIFDEVISGLRYGLRGGGGLLDIVPDLACYGKALGNGYPIAAIAGPRELMREFEEHVFMSGTYAAECLSLAAAGAVLDRLEKDEETVYSRMAEAGALLRGGFVAAAMQAGIKAECVGFPPRTQFRFEDPGHFDRFRAQMCEQGVLLGQDNFLSTAHTIPVIERVVEACHVAMVRLKKGEPCRA